MTFITTFIDIVLHIGDHLLSLIGQFGNGIYLITWGIIFVETGVVIMPFLPGDSMIFALGAITSQGYLNIFILWGLLTSAAVIGDALNYWIGHYIGPKIEEKNYKLINKAHIEKTKRFYEKHGGKTIIIARFIPIIRTFAPFVAGIGAMHYGKFFIYNILGGFLWVTLFLFAGFFFGNLPFIKNNFTLVILGIIFVSIVPPVISALKKRLSAPSVA